MGAVIKKSSNKKTSTAEKITMKIKSKLKGMVNSSHGNDINSNVIKMDKTELLLMAFVLTEQTIPDDDASLEVVLNNLENAGCERLGANIALRSLKVKDLISLYHAYDEKRNVKYPACRITQKGEDWIIKNRDIFNKLSTSFNKDAHSGKAENIFSKTPSELKGIN